MTDSSISEDQEWQDFTERLKRSAYIFAKAKSRYFQTCKTAWEAGQYCKNVRNNLSGIPFSLPFPFEWLVDGLCSGEARRRDAQHHFEQARYERDNALQCLLEMEQNFDDTIDEIRICRNPVQTQRPAESICSDTSHMHTLRSCIEEAERALKDTDTRQSITICWHIPQRQPCGSNADSVSSTPAQNATGTQATGKRKRADIATNLAAAEGADTGSDTSDIGNRQKKLCSISENVAHRTKDRVSGSTL
ncbi:hypothetical protein MBLNU459_g4301t1 [Dothideomycetes sp. NU459]